MEKQKLYKTAFSVEFGCYVSISSAWKDVDGKWIYSCTNVNAGFNNFLFRESELERFCL